MASRPDQATTSTTPPPLQSAAINRGADLLVELLEQEKQQIAHLYHGALRGLELHLKKAQDQHDAQMAAAEHKQQEQGQRIQDLTASLVQAQSYNTDIAGELEALRAEHEALKLALGQAGLVYVDGQLQLDDRAARIVDEFVKAAKIQEDAMMSSPVTKQYPLQRDNSLSEPVGPSEFFDVLSRVIDKGRKFAEHVEKYQQPQSKSNASDKQTMLSIPQDGLKGPLHALSTQYLTDSGLCSF
uniref:Uncharacterized protein n=1 Tax=Psilocybe cubensis TaxID=181762 RepID=A0A8H8CK24_PSICU